MTAIPLERFQLFFGAKMVGIAVEAFCTDDTWHGTFEPKIRVGDGPLEARILAFVSVVTEWNERARTSRGADPKELEEYADLVGPDLWSARRENGNEIRIAEAPVFFQNGDVSWR